MFRSGFSRENECDEILGSYSVFHFLVCERTVCFSHRLTFFGVLSLKKYFFAFLIRACAFPSFDYFF